MVTGDDFTFGKGRGGNVELLRDARRASTASSPRPSRRCCSTASASPRAASAKRSIAGDTATATHLLSRDFAIEGVVQRGDQRGRELGYPTANLALGDYQRPRYGIYAVRVTLDDGSEHPGVASLGVRPTFDPPQELLEAHLFDFDGDLYGRKIEVALHAFIRDEKKFDDVDALVAQMREDEAQARQLLALPKSSPERGGGSRRLTEGAQVACTASPPPFTLR